MYEIPRSVYSALVAFDATADELLKFVPAHPIVVVRWGMICHIVTTTAPAAAKLSWRPTIESDTGRIETWGGTITLAAVLTVGQVAQHTLVEGEGVDTADLTRRPRGMVIAGEQLVCEITDAFATGDGIFFIEYEPLAAQGHYHEGVGGYATEYAV